MKVFDAIVLGKAERIKVQKFLFSLQEKQLFLGSSVNTMSLFLLFSILAGFIGQRIRIMKDLIPTPYIIRKRVL